MSSNVRLTTPYTGDTPIIRLAVQGPGDKRVVIAGVVDSGADATLLPHSIATSCGVPEEDLTPTDEGSEGAGGAWFPTWTLDYPLKAQVVGVFPEPRGIDLWGPTFDLQPEFAKDTIAMFGRADFFGTFAITFDQVSASAPVFHLDATMPDLE